MNNGFLTNPSNISFSWYTDGVPVFKSSKVSFWPLFLTINELPFHMRQKKENTILAGLWFGDKKPNANNFVYKFRAQFATLANQGTPITLSNPAREVIVRRILMKGTCDLPAKAQFLNVTQFNGDYGCPACYCKGQNIATASGGSVHVYPFQEVIQMRTTEEAIVLGNTATPDNPVMGVKGPTAFSKIMPNFIKRMGIDKMHGIEGGVVKKMLTLLFNSSFRNFPFSLVQFNNVINTRLTAIKPPKFVHRMPRSVDDLLYWKASELRLWFFYYSLPVLEGILRQDYFEHYLLLVIAISALNADKITEQMVINSQDLLRKFVRDFQNLYGLAHMSINVHQLLHLPECVKNLGPLWSFSCFKYKNLNGLFLKLMHGTCHIDTQMVKSHTQFIKMARIFEYLPDGPVKEICSSTKRQIKLLERLTPHCYSVGAYKRLQVLPDIVRNALFNSHVIVQGTIWQYQRLLKNHQLYVAEEYSRALATQSFVVEYIENDVIKLASIHSFIKISVNCDCQPQVCQCEDRHFAIIREIENGEGFEAQGDEYLVNTTNFLRKTRLTDVFSVVNISNLRSVCFLINIDEQQYVAIPVNSKELE